jgi:hypothetical protein
MPADLHAELADALQDVRRLTEELARRDEICRTLYEALVRLLSVSEIMPGVGPVAFHDAERQAVRAVSAGVCYLTDGRMP